MRRWLEGLFCLGAVALVALVWWRTAPSEEVYAQLTPTQAELQRGIDLLQGDPNAPLDVEGAQEHFKRIEQMPAAGEAERQWAALLAGWAHWAASPPDFVAARRTLEKFLRQWPESPLALHAHFLLGLAQRYDERQGDAREAVRQFEQVVAHEPEGALAAYARLQLATLEREKLKRPEAAARWYGEVARHAGGPYQPEERKGFLFLAARMLQQAGRKPDAIATYRELLAWEHDANGVWTERVVSRLDELGIKLDPWSEAQAETKPPAMTQHRFTPDKPLTLQVSFWIMSKQGMGDAIREICRRYHERNPLVTVQIVDLPYGGYTDWLQSRILGRDLPDVLQMDNQSAVRYGANQHRLLDLTDALAQPNPYTGQTWGESFWPQFIQEARDPVSRRNYDISWASENNAFYYNKDAFRKAGIVRRDAQGQPLMDERGKPVPAEPETWADLLAAYEKLRQAGYYGEVCEFFPDPAPLIWQTPYITKQIYHGLIPRLDVLMPDDFPDPFELAQAILTGRLDLREPRVAELWRLQYAKSEYWVPGCTSMDLHEAFDAFARGKAATFYWVSTEVPDFERMCNFELGVFPFPSLRGTKFYDGEYTESPALTAYEFALPRVNEDKGTAAAALDFVQYFTSPEAQQLLIAKGNILSPLRGMPASPRLEPFLRRMNRRGTHRNVFNPYEINIIKEPYWAESRAKVLDEINSLLGNIPNFEFYHRATGGDRQAYAQWREARFNTFLDNLQTHFKWACQRLITEYSEDRRHALRRDQRRWLAALRAATPGAATVLAVPDATLQGTTPEQLWRIVLDDWDVITTCENMLPTAERDRRAMPPALSAQRLRVVARSLQVGLALAAAGLLIGLAWSGVARNMLREARLWVWLAPTLLLLGLFSYYPALSAIYHAFFRWNGAEVAEFIGWDNFRALLADGVLWHGFRLALVFMAANVLKFLPTVAIAVVLFHLASKRAQYMFRVAFVLPLLIPWMVVMLMWKYIYRMDGGLLNTLLIDMGWLHLPVNWLGQMHTVVPSLLMIGFPFISTIGVLILLAGLQAIPETVFEAATLDGCGPLRRFWTLEMPLIAGQLKLNLVLITIQTIQEFALPLVLTRGGPNHASMLPGLWMYFNAFSYGKMGYAAAIGVVMFIVILGFTMLHLRLIRVHRD